MGDAADVAERGGVRGAPLGGREPVADEKEKPRVGQRLAVERQRHEIAGFMRPAGLAKAAACDMRFGRLAWPPGQEGDQKSPAVRIRPLRFDPYPNAFRRQRRERHAAKPGLVGLERRRAAREQGEREQGGEKADQTRGLHAPSRLCFIRLP